MVTEKQFNLDEQSKARLRELGKNFYFFAKAILGFDWLVPHIHRELCDLLQDPTETRICVTFPRGWLKSTVVSIAWPIWLAKDNPEIRILLTQNTHTNATKKLAVIRSIFEKNVLFRALYPELLPDETCTWKNDALEVKRKGSHPEATFECAGTRTTVVSRHYDVIIEDDTVAPDLDELSIDNIAPTKDDIAKAIGWHRLVGPMLVNPETSRNVIVGTRWFQLDLISWNKENELGYTQVERRCVEDGRIVYPERFSQKVLDGLRDSLGEYLFSCLYMNLPLRSEDMTFKEEWFEYYEVPPAGLLVYTTVDPGGDPKDTKGIADYTVVMTCGKDMRTGLIYVLDYFRKRANPGETVDAIFDHVRRFHPLVVGLETVAYQKSLMYWIRERMRKDSLHFMVEGLTNVRSSKEARIKGLQPVFGSRSVRLRTWMRELKGELLAFPIGMNDDLPDAMSMQLQLWKMTRSVKEEKERAKTPDPYLFETAMAELQGRHEGADGVLALVQAGGNYWDKSSGGREGGYYYDASG